MNTISRATIFGAVFIAAFIIWLLAALARSPYATSASVIKEQPVAFSHQHHVLDCGIDCRYCHTSVESSSFAGIPPTQTCMNCHSQLWTESSMLAPVRSSFRTGQPLRWNRVHDLPDFARFDHSVHVRKGVSCTTCHGEVDQMPLMHREATLHMEWCLKCHRHPDRFVGPRELVFASAANPVDRSQIAPVNWVEEYHVQSKTDCSVCHY